FVHPRHVSPVTVERDHHVSFVQQSPHAVHHGTPTARALTVAATLVGEDHFIGAVPLRRETHDPRPAHHRLHREPSPLIGWFPTFDLPLTPLAFNVDREDLD